MAALTAKLQSMQQQVDSKILLPEVKLSLLCLCSPSQSDSSVGVLQKTVRSLEHKLAAAQNELTSSQLSLSQCQQDYNNYKVCSVFFSKCSVIPSILWWLVSIL